jgi:2,3-diketo-5-methylthio-1-phosphopentane phosphatase
MEASSLSPVVDLTSTPPPVVVFDFDHSLIDVNSDTFVPERLGSRELMEFLKAEQRSMQWTRLMAAVALRLHSEGVSRSSITSALAAMPVFPEVLQAIREAKEEAKAELHIVSDANTVYICDFLEARGIHSHFSSVTTNPASYDGEGRLVIRPYHPFEDKPHGCARCPVNMCKGSIIDSLGLSWEEGGAAGGAVAAAPTSMGAGGGSSGAGAGAGADGAAVDLTEASSPSSALSPPSQPPASGRSHNRRVAYVGDGGGDLCAVLRLGPSDVVLAREGYPLASKLAAADVARLVRAKVVLWRDGPTLRNGIRAFLGL